MYRLSVLKNLRRHGKLLFEGAGGQKSRKQMKKCQKHKNKKPLTNKHEVTRTFQTKQATPTKAKQATPTKTKRKQQRQQSPQQPRRVSFADPGLATTRVSFAEEPAVKFACTTRGVDPTAEARFYASARHFTGRA